MYTSPFSIWRKLKPINIVGMFSPYSSCECGNSFIGKQGEGGGYDTSTHGGRIICYDCYKLHIREIQRHNHEIRMEPQIGIGVGYSYGTCSNPFCRLHYNDDRFYWNDKSWRLTKQVEEEGYRLYK